MDLDAMDVGGSDKHWGKILHFIGSLPIKKQVTREMS